MSEIEFSVLLSVYSKEEPEYLDQALKSVWVNQTLKPNEIVIVKDGPLTQELELVIDNFAENAPVQIVSIAKNGGLGKALALGVTKCSYEIIARMDSDDISTHDRFEKQIPIFTKDKIDVLSSWSSFFEKDINNTIATKKRPEFDAEIKSFAKKRSPVCHASCILRKSAILKAGNYQHFPLYEDYDLWVRMIMTGAKFYNLQDYVYLIRTSDGQFGRRGGLKYLITEIRAQNKFRKLGFLKWNESAKNIMIRVIVRLSPNFIRKRIYKIIWSRNN